MNHSTRTSKKLFWRGISVLVLLLFPLVAFAQNPETSKQNSLFAGKYEGTAKGPKGDVNLTLELAEAAGKFSGRVTSPRGVYEVAKGGTADGALTLELDAKGSPAKLSLKQKDDKLVGELTADGQTGPVEFRKVGKDEISGEWEAAADAQGQAVPF